MKIQILGAHNVEALGSRCASILIDGRLALDAGALSSSLTLADQRNLEAILITHQHYDHVCDVPTIALNFYHNGLTLNLYTLRSVGEALSSHLLDGTLYPSFLGKPPEKPAVRFSVVESGESFKIGDYQILPLSVAHGVPAVGYQVTSAEGKSLFYTGDTGSGLESVWEKIAPDLLITEVTFANRHEAEGHLTPNLLKGELAIFQRLRGYLPEVVVCHVSPEDEIEIAWELATVASELGSRISLAYEGMSLYL
ncbi:MAG: MBL fold metallo-hydrolase [Chloroflexota bacterium]